MCAVAAGHGREFNRPSSPSKPPRRALGRGRWKTFASDYLVRSSAPGLTRRKREFRRRRCRRNALTTRLRGGNGFINNFTPTSAAVTGDALGRKSLIPRGPFAGRSITTDGRVATCLVGVAARNKRSSGRHSVPAHLRRAAVNYATTTTPATAVQRGKRVRSVRAVTDAAAKGGRRWDNVVSDGTRTGRSVKMFSAGTVVGSPGETHPRRVFLRSVLSTVHRSDFDFHEFELNVFNQFFERQLTPERSLDFQITSYFQWFNENRIRRVLKQTTNKYVL